MSDSSPLAPPLPPGRSLPLGRRGVTWVIDSGPGSGVRGRRPLLLLHGWTSTAATNWYKCIPALSEEYRVVAMDHRGHGRGIHTRAPFRLEDCADDAAAVVRELDLGPVTVVGYSMGGPIAQLLWKRHPGLVDGLVLCATACRLTRQGIPGLLSFGGSVLLSLAPNRLRGRAMEVASRNWSNNGSAPWALEEWSRHDPAALLQAGLALGSFDSSRWIAQVDVPTAAVITTLDQVVTPERQWAMVRAIPGSVAFPVAGDHRVCVDDPDRFVPALLSACGAAARMASPAL